MKPLVADGAVAASSVASAVDASPVILVCVDDYAVTQGFMDSEDVVPHLPGRTLIQLSTGTPQGAQEAAAWYKDRDVDYIDGEILVLPNGIGADNAQILFAGPESAYIGAEPLLRCLGGDLRFLGDNVRAPAALNLGWLCQRFGMLLGALHGINLCKSENVGVDDYASLFPETDRVHLLARTIHSGNYADPSVSVHIWRAILERIQKQADDKGINNDFPEFASECLNEAVTKGYAEEDIAALFKLF